MELINIARQLKLAVAKAADKKISSMIKNIPMQNGAPSIEAPKAPTPSKNIKAPSAPKPKINTPSTYAGGIDLMAPAINAGGGVQSPGSAWSSNLGG